MDRRIGAIIVNSQFLFPDGVCPEASEEHQDTCCDPRQLAAVLKLEIADVCREMDEIEKRLYQTDTWQEEGATPRMVFDFCRTRGFGAVCVHLGSMVESLPAEPGKPTGAFVVHEAHCYFYSSPRACRALAGRKELRREPGSSDTPPVSTWCPA